MGIILALAAIYFGCRVLCWLMDRNPWLAVVVALVVAAVIQANGP